MAWGRHFAPLACALVALSALVLSLTTGCGDEIETGIVTVVRVSGSGYLAEDSPTHISEIEIEVYGKDDASNTWELTALTRRAVESTTLPLVYGLFPRGANQGRLYMTIVSVRHGAEKLEQKVAIGSFRAGRVGVLEMTFTSGSRCFRRLCVDGEGKFVRGDPCEDRRTECVQTCNPEMGTCEAAAFMNGEDLPEYDPATLPMEDAGMEDAADDRPNDVRADRPVDAPMDRAPDVDAMRDADADATRDADADADAMSDADTGMGCGTGPACTAPGTMCMGGACVCVAGRVDCTVAPGCETDPQNDEMHCGAGPGCVGGMACSGTSCIAGMCTTCSGDGDCDDSLSCTDDRCSSGTCMNPPLGGFCVIGGACFTTGEPSGDDQCQRCNPSVDRFGFTLAIAATCDDDDACTSDDKCMVDGRCIGAATGCDECALGEDNCSPNATCSDDPDGFTCACNPGFDGDGVTCTDLDECAGSGTCDPNATCTNTPGSYDCACNAGYEGDGLTYCNDIDECATTGGGCDVNATCMNTPGGNTCTCNACYTGNGFTCTLMPGTGLPAFVDDAATLARFEFNCGTVDESGNDRHGTAIGTASYEIAPFGSGLACPGTDPQGFDWSPYASLLQHPFTIEIAITPSDVTAYRKLFSFDDASDSGWYYFSTGIASYPNGTVGSGIIASTYHYIAFVSTSTTTMDVWHDNVMLGSLNMSFTAPPMSAIFFRDDSNTARNETLTGVVDAMRISNVSRSASEIQAQWIRLTGM